jgi:ABC-type dipeptide/oligopeptide/nickel transport system permease subunit
MSAKARRGGRTRGFRRFDLALLILYLAVVAIAFAWPFLQGSDSGTPYTLPRPEDKIPTPTHPLGLDDLGRDVLANILSGFKTSFVGGILATSFFLIFGIGLGLFIGFEEKAGAGVVGAVVSGLNSIPKFFALFLAFIVMDRYVPFVLMAILGILSAPRLAEMLKFKISYYRKEDFYDAAIALGLSPIRVVGKHIIWHNARKSIFSELAYMFGYAILSEATLSFILLGSMGPGWQSWGAIINQELSSFSVLVYNLFNPSGGGGGVDNPLKFLAPLASLVATVMLFTVLSRALSEEAR